LSSLGHLHSSLRQTSSTLSTTHPSLICRAVASAVASTHLHAFQQKILAVERSILSNDPLYVGAYDIVPLSQIAAEFAGWERRLGWLARCLEFVEGNAAGGKAKGTAGGRKDGSRSGAEAIDWLRREARTGYPDVECTALDLVAVAERAWVRALASWVLYGRVPASGQADFPIQRIQGGGGGGSGTTETDGAEYRVVPELLPGFVAPATADSILFVGRSLGHVRRSGLQGLEASRAEGAALLRDNLRHLEGLRHPIAATSLAGAVAAIRASLAQKALRRLLPGERIVGLLEMLRAFFLLGRGEFAVAIVAAADECLAGRHLRGGVDLRERDRERLGGVMIREGEVSNVLDKALAALAVLQDIDDDEADEELDMVRDMVSLRIKQGSTSANITDENGLKDVQGLFEDALLATPATLTITVPSPLDLFLTPNERDIYSLINAYLISVRRAHLHLSSLWRLSTLRRVPLAQSSAGSNKTISTPTTGSLTNQRNQQMRSHWAAISSTTFFLAEFGGYLQGEIVAGSWNAFKQWLEVPPESTSNIIEGRDPEILASAHRVYLHALLRDLLLTDPPFTKSLKTLLARCDHLVALTNRLNTIVEALQAHEHATGGLSALEPPPHLVQEELDIQSRLAEASKGVGSLLKSLEQRLNEIDQERLGQALTGLKIDEGEVRFNPWKGGGVRSLLMRLDLRTILDD
ncbi:MAG: hypothetical protein LQ340_004415, partial [Diploschistes diacapsis]